MASPSRWFPTASNGITLPLQTIFQRVLTYVYGNQTNIANLQTSVAAIPVPTATFPAHFNTLGTRGTIAYDTIGNIYMCYKLNLWVRVGHSGTSTSF
jgi:hypothetical protein